MYNSFGSGIFFLSGKVRRIGQFFEIHWKDYIRLILHNFFTEQFEIIRDIFWYRVDIGTSFDPN